MVTTVFTAVMGAIVAVVLREWGQTPREYRGDGVRVCGTPAVMGTGNNYSISKQTQCCEIRKKKSKICTFPQTFQSASTDCDKVTTITVYKKSLI